MDNETIAARLKELLAKMRDGTATLDDEREYKQLKFAALCQDARVVMG